MLLRSSRAAVALASMAMKGDDRLTRSDSSIHLFLNAINLISKRIILIY